MSNIITVDEEKKKCPLNLRPAPLFPYHQADKKMTFKYLVILIFLSFQVIRPSSSELTYAPSKVKCPDNFGMRRGNQSIGDDERAYNEGRRTQVLTHAYREYLKNLNAFIASKKDRNLVLPSYVTQILSSTNQTEMPRLSIAVGGGAYRGERSKISGMTLELM
jgi:hypothetical protein